MRCSYRHRVFHNEGNGYSVCSYATTDTIPEEAHNKRAPKDEVWFTAVGYGLPTSDVVEYEIKGEWANTERYGLQLKVESCDPIMPQTTDGMITYLGSGLIKGVGPKTAESMVAMFGTSTMDILQNDPEQLLRVRGISPAKLEGIKESFQNTHAMQDIMAYLRPYGVGVKLVAKVYEAFEGSAMQMLRESPYHLCKVAGFGFDTVDKLGRNTGADMKDPLRIRGGILHCLNVAANRDGHLFLPRDELVNGAWNILVSGMPRYTIPLKLVETEIDAMLADNSLLSDIGRVYKPVYRQAEVTVARKVLKMLYSPVEPEFDVDEEIAISQKQLGISLGPKQVEAVKMWASNRICILSGGPGTGKTTTLRVILDILQRVKVKAKILLTAPTGRASKRMREATGYPSSSTLHSALRIAAGDDDEEYVGDRNFINYDQVIGDEISMVDQLSAAQLFARLRDNCQLMLVGDPDQLQSVRAGNVLRELLRCQLIPTTILDIIYRQGKASPIVLNAHAINEGRKDDIVFLDGSECVFKPASDGAEAAQIVLETYMEEIKRFGMDKVQVISPYTQYGDASVAALNMLIREAVNPPAQGKAEYKHNGHLWRTGDRVLQTKNNYDLQWHRPNGEKGVGVFNGDTGFITSIYRKDDENIVRIRFDDDTICDYGNNELDNLLMGFAMSTHRVQGSEFDSVIMALLFEHEKLLIRNLLYTGITRAKINFTLVGQLEAMYKAIDNNDVGKRNTLLADRIVSYNRKVLAKRAAS